ncbi:Phosphatidylglycerophosphate synthase [Tistlia consotensis]|uniref:Phosphatidylglycerophosphate synthase n=1 Tax=Tistlia consotensis USBA 355 TaxID=560819 RepID=A0A1Y6B3G1_9PROT|nr:CDP-alcohol phosphatidyltransferase family protein [Tistlia consotensis]SME88099.1 Phosphatidylglycerophosphate synthase [Tistlia consotensis USBA 355]SNR24465.1 Phosphatidylglycerophosphate synthase [Tistlia consotensis]
MLDAALRRLIDPPLERAAARIAGLGITANQITLAGFLVGLLALPALAAQRYDLALAAILANRLADGLDGAVARQRGGGSDLGGFLDIACDFVFYSAVPFGFALAEPANALPAAFVIFSFVGTGSSFLAYAVIAAKRGLSTSLHGRKSLYYLGGLTEGSETIAFLAAICLFPAAFGTLAWIFGGLCWITTASRLLAGRQSFRDG